MFRIKTFLQKWKDPKDDTASTKIFGIPLDLDALEIPTIIVSSLNRLKQSVDEQGLFRVSGDHSQVNLLKKQYDEGHEIDLSQFGAHTVASLFKLFLRELPTPLIGYEIYDGLIATYSIEDVQLRRQLIKKLILTIPDYPRSVLEYVCAFLHFVQQNNSTNKMTSSNLAIVFAPNLMRARIETLEGIINDAPHVQFVVKSLIEEWVYFFNEQAEAGDVAALSVQPSTISRRSAGSIRKSSSNVTSPVPRKPSSQNLTSTTFSPLSRKTSSQNLVATQSPSQTSIQRASTPSPPGSPSVNLRKSGMDVTEEKVDIVVQIQEMLVLAENAVRNQLLPAVDEIRTRLKATTDYEEAMKLAESIRKARKLLNEGPVTQVNKNSNGSRVPTYYDSPPATFATAERLQGIKTSMETSTTTVKTDLIALLAEASSIPENCRQLEAEIALGQMIYIIQLLRNVKQVLSFKEASPCLPRVRSISHDSTLALKFGPEKSLITTMIVIIDVIREHIDSQPSSILLYAARAAANVNSLVLSPLGPIETTGVPENVPLPDAEDNQEAHSSLVEVVNAILSEVEKGVNQFALLVERPDWAKLKDGWHTRSSDILVILEALVLQIDPEYITTIDTRTTPSNPKPPLPASISTNRKPNTTTTTTSSDSDDPFNPPDLVAKGASLTTVFTSVSRTKDSSFPPLESSRAKSSTFSSPSSATTNSSLSTSPNRMIKSPSLITPKTTAPTSSSSSIAHTSATLSPASMRRLSTNTYTRQQGTTTSSDPTKRTPNYDLLRETVRQATTKLEGLVARARGVVDKTSDVKVVTRIVGSLRVVKEMMASNFGPVPPPPPLPASPSLAFLKTKANEAASDITLQLGLLKDWNGGGEEGIFQIAKTLRNVINALQVDPPT